MAPKAVPAAAATFFGAYLLLQTGLPLLCLTEGKACPFAWTMYAGRSNRAEIAVLWTGGDETPLADLQKRHGKPVILSKKVDKTRFVAPGICRQYPEAAAIRIRYPRSGSEEIYRCGS
jgi:hypothetical protein